MGQVLGLHWALIALDITLLSVIIYRLLLLIRGTRAAQMFIGLITIIILSIAADWLELGGLNWLISNLKTVWVVAFLNLFQPELRRALAQVGQSRLFATLVSGTRYAVLGELVKAVEEMSHERIGALIVLQRNAGLRSYVDTGTRLDAAVTSELLLTIFAPRTTLHDGTGPRSGWPRRPMRSWSWSRRRQEGSRSPPAASWSAASTPARCGASSPVISPRRRRTTSESSTWSTRRPRAQRARTSRRDSSTPGPTSLRK
jgi:hypothetical protein